MKTGLLALLVCCAGFAQQTQSVLDQGKVGPTNNADGTVNIMRTGRSGELNTSDAHARYQEAVSRGNVYTATTIQATIGTANNSPLAAGGTPLVGIFNPANSARNFVIWRAIVCTASGTPSAQPLFVWNVIAAPAGITAAGTNGLNNFTFTANSGARVFANAATTGSAAATALRPIGGTTSAATASAPSCTSEETAGDIVVPQGGFAGIAAGNGAGTTWIVSVSMTWEEVTP